MKLNEVATALTPDIAKKANKAVKFIKSEIKNSGKYTLTVEPKSENKAVFVMEFQRYVPELDMKAIDEDFKFAIEQSDEEGHIFKIEVGDAAHGYKFVDSILGGLRPGMEIKAEAFFPTFAYEVTWKMIMKKR
jgi:hypothetical protein